MVGRPRSGEERGGTVSQTDGFESVEEAIEGLATQEYVAERPIGMAVFLALRLQKPLLVEGEPGCGKTDIARAVAGALGRDLIRLQCYEGLDAPSTLYEWNYPKQLLTIRLHEGQKDPRELEEEIFGERFLLKRPLLEAITHDGPRPPVLLIDEIDRADEEFEAFLLELLSDFQVTIPELGTVEAAHRPHVVLTSNGTRELSDALRRRCLYLWIDHPSFEKELRILRLRMPEMADRLGEQVVRAVQQLRGEQLYKTPGIAETLDWARAVRALEVESLDRETIRSTLGCLLKDRHDLERLRGEGIEEVVEAAAGAGGSADDAPGRG